MTRRLSLPQIPSVQLTSAPIVNGVIPAMAALLVSPDFSKPAKHSSAGSGGRGLVDGEVVEEGGHAGPELLGGRGVGLHAAAQSCHLGMDEEREVRAPKWQCQMPG
jgi:hypothetical protein